MVVFSCAPRRTHRIRTIALIECKGEKGATKHTRTGRWQGLRKIGSRGFEATPGVQGQSQTTSSSTLLDSPSLPRMQPSQQPVDRTGHHALWPCVLRVQPSPHPGPPFRPSTGGNCGERLSFRAQLGPGARHAKVERSGVGLNLLLVQPRKVCRVDVGVRTKIYVLKDENNRELGVDASSRRLASLDVLLLHTSITPAVTLLRESWMNRRPACSSFSWHSLAASPS